jgi:hypothetical protein
MRAELGETAAALFQPVKNNVGGTMEGAITADGIYKMVKRYAKRVGVNIEGFGAHSLRATIATTRLYDRRKTRLKPREWEKERRPSAGRQRKRSLRWTRSSGDARPPKDHILMHDLREFHRSIADVVACYIVLRHLLRQPALRKPRTGYALPEPEGRVYYMKYGTKKNAEFTNRR